MILVVIMLVVVVVVIIDDDVILKKWSNTTTISFTKKNFSKREKWLKTVRLKFLYDYVISALIPNHIIFKKK